MTGLRMRVLAITLAIIFLILQGQLWLGQGSLVDLWRLRDDIQAQQLENRALQERNLGLAAEVADLKQGLEAVEERARSELGMIRRGETFYQVADPVREQAENDVEAAVPEDDNESDD